MDTLHSLADEQCQLLDQPLPFGQLQRSRYQYACPFGQRGDPVHDVGHRVAADLPARYGRIGASDAREEQFQVVVDFGRRADGRARIPRVDLLLDRDGRSDSGNQVDVGLVDLAQKLAGVGRQAFDVASLALGEDGVERERRLARADSPVTTTSWLWGILISMFLRLCTRAPLTWMYFRSFESFMPQFQIDR